MEIYALIFFVLVLGCLMCGYPVAYTLGGVSIIFGISIFGIDFFSMLPMRIWGVMSNYVLVAVPLFIFMGVMLERSGIAEELLETMALLFGRLRGGLAIGVLVVGILLGASTGIVGATVVTMGVLSLPIMLKRNYKHESATGIIMASGTLGQIIPPSIVLVLLGSVMNTSVGDLFIAAIIPSSILVTLYLVWIIVQCFVNKNSMPSMPEEDLRVFRTGNIFLKIVRAFLLPGILILIVLGSIFAGVTSPTEAAGVGAAGAILLAAIRGKLSLKNLNYVLVKTMTITSMAFMILVGASAFALVFRGLHGEKFLVDLIMMTNMEPTHFLIIVMILIFVAGFFIDFIEITFIIVPIVAPIFLTLGIDLIWVGILIAVNLQTSFLTPPFGFAIFYLKGVSPKEIKTTELYKGIVPYVVIQLIVIGILLMYPELTSWLPAYFK